MPIARVQLPDGRIARLEVPDGTTPEQVEAYVQEQGPELAPRGEREYQGAMPNIAKVLKNAPGSLGGQAMDLVNAVTHPVETGQNMYDLARGGLSHAGVLDAEQEQEAKASALADMYRQRYSDWETFKTTLEEDPFEIVGDFATALTLGGGAASKIGKLAKAGAVEKAGNIATKVGGAIDPLNITKNVAKVPARALSPLSDQPRKRMMYAFGLDDPNLAQFAIEKGYSPTIKSFEKFKNDRRAAKADVDIANMNNRKIAKARIDEADLRDMATRLRDNGQMTAKASGQIAKRHRDLKRIIEIERSTDKNILAASAEYKKYGQLSDKFPGAVGQTMRGGGRGMLDTGIPGGLAGAAGYGLASSLGVSGPGAAAIGGGIMLGGHIYQKPTVAAWMAQQLVKMPLPMAGFTENKLLFTLSQQAIREIGAPEAAQAMQPGQPGQPMQP